MQPRLFLRKTAVTLMATFALLPLISLKSDLPALAYLIGLVVLHIAVLVVYVYRVRFRDLDGDLRSLGARVFALAVVTYLLFALSSFSADATRGELMLQLLLVMVLHTVLLLLLMVRVRFGDATSEGRAVSAAPSDTGS
jgi:RsiW-degrading membrane proteinase PrsW (M82 family)